MTYLEKLDSATFRFTDAGNTRNPALLVLASKGYELGFYLETPEDEYPTWYAEKDGKLFIAIDPLSLLGLVAIWENRGEKWGRTKDEPNLYDALQESINSR